MTVLGRLLGPEPRYTYTHPGVYIQAGAEEEKRLRVIRERQEKARATEHRARELLKSYLNTYQRETLLQYRFIDARGSQGGRFRVYTSIGLSHNVLNCDSRTTYCYHLSGREPVSDHLLAQLVIVTTDQESLARYPAYPSYDLGHILGIHPSLMPWRCE